VTTGYALLGAAVEVLGQSVIVSFASGTNQATGTVDVKIQESDDNTTWTDWTGGAFTQVTTANDNATYEKQYTGSKRYIRVVGKVLLAACEFGVNVLRLNPQVTEDALLNDSIMAARGFLEDITRRAFLTQTWDYSLQNWPGYGQGTLQFEDYQLSINTYWKYNFIKLPFGNLQSVVSVKYKDLAGVETTMVEGVDYIVETNGDQCGRIVLPYATYWPFGILYPSNPITIRFTCGWTTAALIPYQIKVAMKMICAGLYENREDMLLSPGRASDVENMTVPKFLASAKLWDEF
jgi:hypothetical protein